MEELTPYVVLGVRPTDNDLFIRQRFHALSKEQHPDRPGAGGAPGPLWYVLTAAYQAIKNGAAREMWVRRREKLAGLCSVCRGDGVTWRRLGKDRSTRVCAACGGLGRRK